MDRGADMAETTYTIRIRDGWVSPMKPLPVRLIVRRVKPLRPVHRTGPLHQLQLHGFITDRDGEKVKVLELEADHRRHAEIENAIRDLKHGRRPQPSPTRAELPRQRRLAGRPGAGTSAHNLARWTARTAVWPLYDSVVVRPPRPLRRRTTFSEVEAHWPNRIRLTRYWECFLTLLSCDRAGLGKPSSLAPFLESEPCHCHEHVNVCTVRRVLVFRQPTQKLLEPRSRNARSSIQQPAARSRNQIEQIAAAVCHHQPPYPHQQ